MKAMTYVEKGRFELRENRIFENRLDGVIKVAVY